MTPTFAVLLPSLRKAQPGYARPGGSLPPDPPRAGGILPPDPPLSRSGPPSCPSYTRTPNRASPGRGEASPRTPLVPVMLTKARPGGSLPPDPPRAGPPSSPPRPISKHVIADCEKSARLFFLQICHTPASYIPGAADEKKKKGTFSATFSATPRNVRRAPPRQIHKRANMFWKELSVVFFKIGGKKTPPLKLFSFFLP